MKFSLIFMILLSWSARSFVVTVNSKEETILSYPVDILVTNCSPSRLGYISSLESPSLLKFSPRGKTGEVVCSAHTKKDQVITTRFILKEKIKRPIVKIGSKRNFKGPFGIEDFRRFILGDTSHLVKVSIRGTLKTKNFRYKFLKKYESPQSFYLYKFLVTPKNKKKFSFNSQKITPIMFSYKDKKHLYIMTNGHLRFSRWRRALP